MESLNNFLKMLDLASGASIMDSYLHYDKLMQEKTIVPGSFKWFTEDSSSIQLNEKPLNGASTTRVRLGPIQMCTHPSLNVIDWSIEIDAKQLIVQLGSCNADTGVFNPETHAQITENVANEDSYLNNQIIEFWIGFPHAAALFNQRIILPASAGASKSTLDYAAQEALISMLSIPKFSLSGNEGFLGLEDLMVGSNPGPGKIIRIPMTELKRANDAAGINVYNAASNAKTVRWIPGFNGDDVRLTINGIIDLNLLDPLYGSFPIMTPQWVNTYLQLNMDNPLKNLQVIQLNIQGENNYLPIIGGMPPEKPQPVYMKLTSIANETVPKYALRYIRFLNVVDLKIGAEVSIYNRPVHSINGRWKYLRTRQAIFQLENQDEIMNGLTKRGALITPVKHFTTYNFNGVGYTSNMVSTGISSENIDKIYIQLPYMLEYPMFLPNPLLRDISPVFKNVLFNVSDDYFDAHARQKILNCFIDTDKASPSRNLMDSVHFKNLDQVNDTNPYGVIRMFNSNANVQSLVNQGSKTPIYHPNQFVLAYDLGGGNEFRGANSKIPGSYSTYSPAETFRLTSRDSQQTTNITSNPANNVQNSLSDWINNCHYGSVTNAKGTSILSCLCFGKMITKFNPGTGTVEGITIE